MRNIAFLIEEIWWEGNLLKGKCTTANTMCGRDMKGLIEQGCRVAFSLRAQGNVHTNPVSGLVEVEDGLQILCYDFVAVPSHAQAFMEKICEATIMAMYKTNKKNMNSTILCESEDLFMQGKLLNIEPSKETVEMDYTRKYTDKFKQPEEMYRPEPEDEVKSIGIKETFIVNSSRNVQKKVLTEDYIVKDIRSRLCQMSEAPWASDGTYRSENLVKDKEYAGAPNKSWYTGTAEFKGKRDVVYGHKNPDVDKLHGLDLTPEEAQKHYQTIKNSQLKEGPTGEESGRWYSDKNIAVKKELPDGRYIGVGVKNGERAEQVIGHRNREIDIAQHSVMGTEKDHDKSEAESRRELRGNAAYNIHATHEKMYGDGGAK